KFSKKYPKTVLLLKGANVIIAQNEKLYVNSFGSAVLSKGGSGDVLSGLIGSLLAQGYKPLDAAISASLAHTLAAKNYKKNNYSLSPQDLIEEINNL
ncbi:bifunctional ADP-dependent NAD(P)H-hydrate dehydratase/NAD(P)H-hydrate epimerase, partial [Aliarcobacter butzleri]|nr:bifunctional ADP-dependent NAD(P)H-hydrate dehydratase/NAD(P)H-hydrate epimerase [Aliarcobacter butzleri]